MMAVARGHAEVVKQLLSAGANIEAADKVILMTIYCMAVSFVLLVSCCAFKLPVCLSNDS